MVTISINTSDGKSYKLENSTQEMADRISRSMNFGGTFQVTQGAKLIILNSAHVASILFVKEDM